MSRTPLTEPGVRRLARRSAEARRILVGRVVDAALRRDSYTYWGQFLDLPRRHEQHGIYGSSAAIEILLGNEYGPGHDLILGATKALPIVGNGAGYADATDLGLVFKVAAIVSVTSAGSAEVDMDEASVSALLEMAVDTRGWGHYAFVNGHRDQIPQIVPTAVAVLALQRVRKWRTEEQCLGSLRWLAEQLGAGGTSEVEDALGLLALAAYRSPGTDLVEWRTALPSVVARVSTHVHRRGGSPMRVPYHYWVRLSGNGHENRYMFFLPEIAGAAALLAAEPSGAIAGSRGVLRVVTTVVDRVVQEQGYRGEDHRLSTVDQMWVDRLLREFMRIAEDAERLVPRLVAPLATRAGRAVVAVALLLIGLACSIIAVGESLNTVLRGVAAALAALAFGIVVTAITLFGGE